ncbi:hypothetical protein ACU686_44620 [Yinghuangia aomiensis]
MPDLGLRWQCSSLFWALGAYAQADGQVGGACQRWSEAARPTRTAVVVLPNCD